MLSAPRGYRFSFLFIFRPLLLSSGGAIFSSTYFGRPKGHLQKTHILSSNVVVVVTESLPSFVTAAALSGGGGGVVLLVFCLMTTLPINRVWCSGMPGTEKRNNTPGDVSPQGSYKFF